MDVFISWSGQRSQAVAQALRDWLPKVIQSLHPWMSASDIEQGARWSLDVAQKLQQCKVGLICLTTDNLTAPWIMFEAGALSKTLEATYVIPYLFQIEISELQGPLTQFQAVKANQTDTKKLMETINRACGDSALPEAELHEQFDMWWPRLEKSLQGVPEPEKPQGPQRTQKEILEEVLSLVRTQSQQIAALSQKPTDPIGVPGARVPVNVPTALKSDFLEALLTGLRARQGLPTTPAQERDSEEKPRDQQGSSS